MFIRPMIPLDQREIDSLAGRLQGQLILPGDDGYNEARHVWNGMIDRFPLLIVCATTIEDVVAAVTFANQQDMLLSVRGGGHSVAGHGTNDGGLVLDLSAMNDVTVDPEQRVVYAGGGATIGDLDSTTQSYGLAVPLGVVSPTGIAGLTLSGGYGWLRNKHGLSCDNLLEAELVTAAGDVIRASKDENPELLWALRGGGGNFGVVTEFVFQAHAVGPQVMFAFVFHDAEGPRMADAILFYRDYCETAPDEVSSLLSLGVIPPDEELFPREIHGRPFALFGALYAGPIENGKKALEPLISFDGAREPFVDFSSAMPYLQAQTMFDADYPDGHRYYWKSLNLSRLDDRAIARIVAHTRRIPSTLSTVDLWHVGGAVSSVGPQESAHLGRDAAFLLNPEANWQDPADDEANVNWVRDFLAEMRPFSDGSRYLNFAGFQEEGEEMMRDAYGNHYARLMQIKQQYDPGNLFRMNPNVSPDADDAY